MVLLIAQSTQDANDMSDFKVFTGGGSAAHKVSVEMSDRIKDVIYEYSGKVPVATAIGVRSLLSVKS